MGFRECVLAALECARAVRGPNGLDLNTTGVLIRTRRWQGGRVGIGPYTQTDLDLGQKYPVRYMSGQEIAASGGRYQEGDVRVGPITPAFPTGGYTHDQLAPEPTRNGEEIIYVLSGAIVGEYARVYINVDKAFTYSLHLRRRGTTP